MVAFASPISPLSPVAAGRGGLAGGASAAAASCVSLARSSFGAPAPSRALAALSALAWTSVALSETIGSVAEARVSPLRTSIREHETVKRSPSFRRSDTHT